jgi:hypothetical protein
MVTHLLIQLIQNNMRLKLESHRRQATVTSGTLSPVSRIPGSCHSKHSLYTVQDDDAHKLTRSFTQMVT